MVYCINLRARFVTGTNSSINSTILFTGGKFGGNIYLKMEGIRFYNDNHLWTPQVLTDENGQIAWYGDYEPFGKVNILVERTTNNFRFPGQYFIEETGLYYNWWRWYGTNISRYIQTDPIKYEKKGNSKFYEYVNNNALIYYDKTGLIKCDNVKLRDCLLELGLAIANAWDICIMGCMLSPNPPCCVIACDIIFGIPEIVAIIACFNEYCYCMKERC